MEQPDATPTDRAAHLAVYFANDKPKAEYKYLFLFGSGQWDEFKDQAPEAISNGRSPTAWELRSLNNLSRCHQVAFDWTDAHVATQAAAHDIDRQEVLSLIQSEHAYERALASQRQKIAQTISRYYWEFLLIPIVWQRLLVQPETGMEETLPDKLELEEFARLMLFDGWMAIPDAQLFRQWMEGLGLKCNLRNNFLSICRFPVQHKSNKAVNRLRWNQLRRWLEESLLDSPEQMAILDPIANDDTAFRLNQKVLAGNCMCDLPLPFDSTKAVQHRDQPGLGS
jgi:hypothetical protein